MAEEPLPSTQRNLLSVLRELQPLEPIFHTQEFGTTLADFEARMSPDYWEVGASGRIYSREFILDYLSRSPPVDASASGWHCSDHALRPLGPDTYLLTYTLRQQERITRRATVWRKTSEGWRILYHQGTVATLETRS